MRNELNAFFDRVRPAIDATLDSLLPSERETPAEIHKAMRYSAIDGGKRIRPCLCIAAYAAYREDLEPILPVASAIELIHTYSLVHDDLPAMDNDDIRRGKPSCHKQFTEAIAILAGDALLTLAFEILSACESFPPDRMLRVVSFLSRASGTSNGMIAGQVLDLQAEGVAVTAAELEAIHRSKTGALIGASVWTGAYLGGAPEADLQCIRQYCDRIGLAFQVIDDILDENDGRDRDRQKATYPGIYGLEKSRTIAQHLMAGAREAIAPLGGRAQLLVDFCDYLENRSC
jgi:geranylgeranyl diphosphate synthase, type II